MCHNPLERVTCNILSNIEIATNIYDMVVAVGDMALIAKPGQFVNLYSGDSAKLLPRPISICNIDLEAKTIRLIYAVVGEGTKDFAKLVAGNQIDVLGPLGSGFTLSGQEEKEVLIVGGGVGTPPLLQLAKTLKNIYKNQIQLTIVLGFRDEVYLVEEFKTYGKVLLATDSGKYGFKGNVIALMKETFSDRLIGKEKNFDYMYSCGPTPMLKGLQLFNTDYTIAGEFSLEERMGCGFGGCVGCVVGIRTMPDQSEEFEYKKVCKDGPVFEYSEVIF